MMPENSAALRARLKYVCACPCGFRRLCVSTEDAQQTASRHAGRSGHNALVETVE